MLQSKLFSKTRHEAPQGEVAKNAELLIKGGFIHKEMAGVYSYLPLGLRALNKINALIRREMNAIGGQEVLLTALQSKEVWEQTNRWSDDVVDNWFKTELKSGAELGLGFTHEEPLTNLMKEHVSSYRDLPVSVYQIQTKFRNEARAKSGIMRGREFLMKDMYSFSKDEVEHKDFYEKAKIAYKNIFREAGIGHRTYLTFASGGSFSKYSHEFQTITSVGEDAIFVCKNCNSAVNKEIMDEQKVCPECGGSDFKEENAVEVGNIFSLGTKFSDAFKLYYENEKGKSLPVVMGSYGIGPGRLMGTIVEVLSDDKGIIWPEAVAPFAVHLLSLGIDEKVLAEAKRIYESLSGSGIEVLYDDREGVSAGEKFADADLIGIPWRAVVSARSMEAGGVEVKKRTEPESKIVPAGDLARMFGAGN